MTGVGDLRRICAKRLSSGVTPARVDQQQADIGVGNRLISAAAHARLKTIARCLFKTGRVDDLEGEVAKMRLALAPVARDAGRVVHQCKLLAHQPIEQGGLADIGPTDNGDRE